MTPVSVRRLVPGVLAALILAGCAAIDVGSFVSRDIDFSRYRTFDWAPVEVLATGDPRLDNNPFFHERVQGAVEEQLGARGFEMAAEAPDLLLHYHASVTQRVDANGVDQKYGYCDECTPFVHDAGTLTIDLVDARTSKLIWRGWAERAISGVIDSQDALERQVDAAVARILAKLPARL